VDKSAILMELLVRDSKAMMRSLFWTLVPIQPLFHDLHTLDCQSMDMAMGKAKAGVRSQQLRLVALTSCAGV
jgi:hypothetical protein